MYGVRFNETYSASDYVRIDNEDDLWALCSSKYVLPTKSGILAAVMADLYNGLKECGFECIKPQGAFYLFVKTPVPNEKEFCEAAKKYNILIVPGSSFACPGYVRLAYCVSHETIVNSLPKFKELAKEYF